MGGESTELATWYQANPFLVNLFWTDIQYNNDEEYIKYRVGLHNNISLFKPNFRDMINCPSCRCPSQLTDVMLVLLLVPMLPEAGKSTRQYSLFAS